MRLSAERLKTEALLFAIEVHGPQAFFDALPIMRLLYKEVPALFHEVEQALLDKGVTRGVVYESLFGRQIHDKGCACWDCIFRLQASIIRTAAKRAIREAKADAISARIEENLAISRR